MGRWTVAEWQAQQQRYSFPGGMDMDEDGYEVGRYPHRIHTMLDDDHEEVEDELDCDAYARPLPVAPPSPPLKTLRATTHAFPVVIKTASAGCSVSRLFSTMKPRCRTRGKRGKTPSKVATESEKPGRMSDRGDNSLSLSPRGGGPAFLMVTPPVPRSPDARRPREFLARSGVKRTKSKSKSSATPKPGPERMAADPTGDGYTYHAQGLEVFVSTQTTATASAPDARRPRVFFPRSSSLAAGRNPLQALSPPPLPKIQPNKRLPTRSPQACVECAAYPPASGPGGVSAMTFVQLVSTCYPITLYARAFLCSNVCPSAF
ncbi:hypothetical protein C8R43DRAFT_346591 [Mycena crocata]|nr:hypothetical protein C8R43DRAFT_346591 [Mycena crocata]